MRKSLCERSDQAVLNCARFGDRVTLILNILGANILLAIGVLGLIDDKTINRYAFLVVQSGFAILYVRAIRLRFSASLDAVEIRNLFRSRRLKWSEITRIDTKPILVTIGWYHPIRRGACFRHGAKSIAARAFVYVGEFERRRLAELAQRHGVPADLVMVGTPVGL